VGETIQVSEASVRPGFWVVPFYDNQGTASG